MGQSSAISKGWSYLAMALGGAAIGALFGGMPMLLASNVASGAAATASNVETASANATASTHKYEIIAFEAPGCVYCLSFRKDMARSYERSDRAKVAPIRYVDVNAGEVRSLKLAEAITQLPTAVVMRDGEEIGRIGGYIGREGFVQALDTLIGN